MTRAREKANLTQKVTTSEPTQLTNGMIWLDTDAVAVSQQSMRWTKTPSGGTTVLSGASDTSITLSYSTGQEQVYANGVLLIRGSDYTASDGTSITLASASVAGDVFEVISIIPLTLVDTYTQAQANSAFIPKTLTTTTGDLLYASSANTPARLAVGSTNQFLSVSGGVPSWAGTYTSFTPTITAGSGTFTTVSASSRYLVIGKMCHWIGRVTITTVGTASGAVVLTLPVTRGGALNVVGYAEETAAVGFSAFIFINDPSGASILKGDYTSVIGAGRGIDFNITYEVA